MNLSGNKLTCNSSGNTWPQLSQLAEPLWTDPGIRSGISVRKPISTFKKKKKAQEGNNGQTFKGDPKQRNIIIILLLIMCIYNVHSDPLSTYIIT